MESPTTVTTRPKAKNATAAAAITTGTAATGSSAGSLPLCERNAAGKGTRQDSNRHLVHNLVPFKSYIWFVLVLMRGIVTD